MSLLVRYYTAVVCRSNSEGVLFLFRAVGEKQGRGEKLTVAFSLQFSLTHSLIFLFKIYHARAL